MLEFSSSAPTLEELRRDQEMFNYNTMKWGAYQTPRSLLLALIGELGELATDISLNDSSNLLGDCRNNEKEILAELADVFCYLICLAHECQIDVANLVQNRNTMPCFSFTGSSWKEIQATAFLQVSDGKGMAEDFLKLCFSVSAAMDIFQWTPINKNLTNLSLDKQQQVDKIIKSMFCHIVFLASKYGYDLPRLLQEKNNKTKSKYSDSIGMLSKDNIITQRYNHLPSFHGSPESYDSNEFYHLDKPVKCLQTPVQKLLCDLVTSIGYICEAFQWDTDGEAVALSEAKHAHLAHQLCIIVTTIQTIAQVHKVSLSLAYQRKMQMNRSKYPLSVCNGSFTKYNDNSDTSHNAHEAASNSNSYNEHISVIHEAVSVMATFVKERNWLQYHINPRNLSLALFGEIGEVIELFILERNVDFVIRLGEELSDCIAYSVRLASCCNIQLTSALLHYFP